MKLTKSLDRACAERMRSAARPRMLMLIILGCALVAPLIAGSALATAVGLDDPVPVLAAAGILGGFALTGPLRSPDGDGPDGGDAKMTIGERLNAAIATKVDLQRRLDSLATDLADAQEASAGHAGQIVAMNSEIAAAQQKLAAAESELASAHESKATAEAEAARMLAEAKTADERAQEIVAGLGFPAGKLPAADDKGDSNDLPSSTEELEEQLAKLPTHREKSALIRRYEAARA